MSAAMDMFQLCSSSQSSSTVFEGLKVQHGSMPNCWTAGHYFVRIY